MYGPSLELQVLIEQRNESERLRKEMEELKIEIEKLREFKEKIMNNDPQSFCRSCEIYIDGDWNECEKCYGRFCESCRDRNTKVVKPAGKEEWGWMVVCKECVPDQCILCSQRPMQIVCSRRKCGGYCNVVEILD